MRRRDFLKSVLAVGASAACAAVFPVPQIGGPLFREGGLLRWAIPANPDGLLARIREYEAMALRVIAIDNRDLYGR